jgi:Rrf2 family protein
MEITRQADYALRSVLLLARTNGDAKLSTAQIAGKMKIPPSFLAKIMSQLSIAGVIRTARGAHGGVALARPAETISMLEVVEAIDGSIKLNACTTNADLCEFGHDCPIHEVWCMSQVELVEKLRKTHFGQLAKPKTKS